MLVPWIPSSQNRLDHPVSVLTSVEHVLFRPKAGQKRMQAEGALVSHTTKV